MNDGELLRRYCTEGCEGSFLELTRRHLPRVYAVARRRVGDDHAAEEVSQAVFCLLVRKGRALKGAEDLTGWLHRAACFKSLEYLRAERRRRHRELNAGRMLHESADSTDPWAEVAPHIDASVDALRETDRMAILLRFYRKLSFREVAESLGVSEDAARMRVTRALEQLRGRLTAAGVSVAASGMGSDWLDALGVVEPISPACATRIGDAARAAIGPAGRGAVGVLGILHRGRDWVQEGVRSVGRLWGQHPVACGGIAVLGGVGIVGLMLVRASDDGERAALQKLGGDALALTVVDGRSMGSAASEKLDVVAVEGLADMPSGPDPLIDSLWQILRSTIQDNVYPPDDLRSVIRDLAVRGPEALAILDQVMRDPEAREQERLRAIWGCWLLGEEAPELMPDILAKLTGVLDRIPPNRSAQDIFDVLRHLDVPVGSIQIVADRVERNAEWVSQSVRFFERAMSLYPEETRTRIAQWLEVGDPWRLTAACALAGHEGYPAENLAPILMEGLRGLDSANMYRSLYALERYGSKAKFVAPDLVELIEAADSRGQALAKDLLIKVLAATDPSVGAHIPEVVELAAQREADARWNALTGEGTPTVEDLVSGLDNPLTVWKAALALEAMGPAAADALPALRAAVEKPDSEHRSYLANAIKAIDPSSPKPVYSRDDLLIVLRSIEDRLKEVHWDIEPERMEALEEFIERVRDVPSAKLGEMNAALEEVHPSLAEVFRENMLKMDPAARHLLP